MAKPQVIVDEVGNQYRGRIVVQYKRESALSISPEKFFEPKIVDLVILPGLYNKKENAESAAQNILNDDNLRRQYGIRN